MRDFTHVSRSVTPRPTRSRVHGAYVVAASKPTAVAEPGAAYSSQPPSREEWRAIWLRKLNRKIAGHAASPAAERWALQIGTYLRVNPGSPYRIPVEQAVAFAAKGKLASLPALTFFYEHVAPSEKHVAGLRTLREEGTQSPERAGTESAGDHERDGCDKTAGAQPETGTPIAGRERAPVASTPAAGQEGHSPTGTTKRGDEADTYVRRLADTLRSKNKSPCTVRNYTRAVGRYLRETGADPQTATTASLEEYLISYNADGKRSGSTVNNAMYALKYFYGKVLKRDVAGSLEAVHVGEHLPKVLGHDKMPRVVGALSNIKHQALLAVAYGGGLRIGEVVPLLVTDLDFQDGAVRVRGKGDKDRYTLLSNRAAEIVRQYMERYKPRKYLFEGQKPGTHLTTRSALKVFHKALDKAGIPLEAGFHTLRHSFATHLLRSGRSTREVQLLLGHKHVNTTEIYTHIAAKDLLKIPSPLDVAPESSKDPRRDTPTSDGYEPNRWHPKRKRERP